MSFLKRGLEFFLPPFPARDMVMKCKELAITKPTAVASSPLISVIGPAVCLRVCVSDWRIRGRDLFLRVPSFVACACVRVLCDTNETTIEKGAVVV